MKTRNWFIWIAVLLALAGCEPSDQKKAELEEKRRLECLDKFCPGDVEPPHDQLKEEALKINGQWYVGPKSYFTTGFNGGAFYWPSKTPLAGLPGGGGYPEKGTSFYDRAIEIFLSSVANPSGSQSTYQGLLEEERLGQLRVREKLKIKPGLDAWKTESAVGKETWFIATNSKLPNGDPPVIACRGRTPEVGRCSGGFRWKPDVWVSLRFRATHGPDWPEIYLEIDRVLQQLRKV